MENNFNNLIQDLLKVASSLEDKKQVKLAFSVDKIANNLVSIKTAQFLGVQGYRLENGRCMDNCVRVKKAKGGNKSSQEIKNACMDEYVQYVNKKNDDWGKYASNSVGFKKFSQVEAIQNKYKEDYVSNIDSLLNLAVEVKSLGYSDDVKKIASISEELIKEAQFWQGVKDFVSGRTGLLKQFKSFLTDSIRNLANQNAGNKKDQILKNIELTNKKHLMSNSYRTLLQSAQKNPDSNLNKALKDYEEILSAWTKQSENNPNPKIYMDLANRIKRYLMGDLEQAIAVAEKKEVNKPQQQNQPKQKNQQQWSKLNTPPGSQTSPASTSTPVPAPSSSPTPIDHHAEISRFAKNLAAFPDNHSLNDPARPYLREWASALGVNDVKSLKDKINILSTSLDALKAKGVL
jgi:hypothetical protein